jgi:CTP:molybdopterin cytidylyltransferase MocA
VALWRAHAAGCRFVHDHEVGVVAGIVLAAGAGTRMGRPKGLVRSPDGTPWVSRAVTALAAGGCAPILVVTGARAEAVQELVPAPGEVVVARGWSEGMGASLRAGLRALEQRAPAVVAVIITLVDMPGVTAQTVARLRRQTGSSGPGVLARAGYDGVPGHPVLIGREHWAGVIATAVGDAGARGYLAGRPDVVLVEAADVGSGEDVDTPDRLR